MLRDSQNLLRKVDGTVNDCHQLLRQTEKYRHCTRFASFYRAAIGISMCMATVIACIDAFARTC